MFLKKKVAGEVECKMSVQRRTLSLGNPNGRLTFYDMSYTNKT